MLSGFERPRWRRRQQLVEQRGQALDFGFDQLREFARALVQRPVVADATREQLRRPLQAGERIAQFMGKALQRGRQRRRQCQRGVLARELIDRMRLQQPAALVAPRQHHVREARRTLAGKRQRQAPQSRQLRWRADRQQSRQGIAFVFERRQRQARQALAADPEPAREREVGALDMTVRGNPGHGRGQGVEVRGGADAGGIAPI